MNQFANVESYINGFDGKAKEYLQKIRSIIFGTVPDSEELINYNIAAFTLTKGGKREELVDYKKAKGSV
ncbi:hypothetical protein [Ulvibacterium sp.]|uniref:hypothetical protein n=1 Tax=Ulvibacterium sp. TaxID=2665914 RepID=UPI003BAD238E